MEFFEALDCRRVDRSDGLCGLVTQDARHVRDGKRTSSHPTLARPLRGRSTTLGKPSSAAGSRVDYRFDGRVLASIREFFFQIERLSGSRPTSYRR